MIDAGPLPGACQELKEVVFHFPAPSRAEFDSIVSLHTRLPQLEVISTPACDTSLVQAVFSCFPALVPPGILPLVSRHGSFPWEHMLGWDAVVESDNEDNQEQNCAIVQTNV